MDTLFDFVAEEGVLASAGFNMDSDYERLLQLKSNDPVRLRYYNWKEPAATYGYFIKPEEHLFLDQGLDLSRRPTGGGVIFHLSDLAFSILLPNSHPVYNLKTTDSYAFINRCIVHALGQMHYSSELSETCGPCNGPFCMAKPTIYDIVLDGKKIGGAAQRKTKQGLLHQGSLFIEALPEEFLRRTVRDPRVCEAILNNSFPLKSDSEELKANLTPSFRKFLSGR